MVCSGQEGFYVKMGPYNFLGVETLTNKEFIPDFSAKVINNARLLRITYHDYQTCLKKIKQVRWQLLKPD